MCTKKKRKLQKDSKKSRRRTGKGSISRKQKKWQRPRTGLTRCLR
jgi:hypothetical protein